MTIEAPIHWDDRNRNHLELQPDEDGNYRLCLAVGNDRVQLVDHLSTGIVLEPEENDDETHGKLVTKAYRAIGNVLDDAIDQMACASVDMDEKLERTIWTASYLADRVYRPHGCSSILVARVSGQYGPRINAVLETDKDFRRVIQELLVTINLAHPTRLLIDGRDAEPTQCGISQLIREGKTDGHFRYFYTQV